MNQDDSALALIPTAIVGLLLFDQLNTLTGASRLIFIFICGVFTIAAAVIYYQFFSARAQEHREKRRIASEIPRELKVPGETSIFLGQEENLEIPIFISDQIRLRHIHVLGATGSGKTESVILNFLRQDVERGLGGIILDAKGDHSFLRHLWNWIPQERLKVFDLSDPKSSGYDPLQAGLPLEAAQRLFSSLTWSEEYYKSKALSALQRIFQIYFKRHDKNPSLRDLANYLEHPDAFAAFTMSHDYPANLAAKEFQDLLGLRDQVRSLCIGHLGEILSPKSDSIDLCDSESGAVIYFRLQSLMSPQVVSTLGKLIINHLSFLAGTAHRDGGKMHKLVPVYLDEFASFACPEFADLVSKARSAGMALHFSHQSIGDLTEISAGFLNKITDNSATKIILRINDPDSAEFFSRSFGTKIYQKVTQRITNAKEIRDAEIVGEGTTREAHQFRTPPDIFKTLPTGHGAVLIAHGQDTPHGASSVFRIRFPDIRSLPDVTKYNNNRCLDDRARVQYN
ncbi:MAG: type IV secretory system conjugative DNA transfer family protein [Bdellovibrionales bacterium]